jgi:hypothetical protein
MKNRKNRSIIVIADEIRAARKDEAANVFVIGALLAEAKKQVKHGEWLSWLRKEFSMSARTAERSLGVHELKPKLKSDTVSNFSASALYWLAANFADLNSFQLTHIFRVARKKMVGATEIRRIAASHHLCEDFPPSEDIDPSDAPPSAPEDPPPELPPPPAPALSARDQYFVDKFIGAIRILKELTTKPNAKFVNVVATDELQLMKNFLDGIAKEQTKTKAEKS